MIPIPGFHMIRQLGDGGAAYVYEAINPEQDRRVALKVLKPEHEPKPGVLRRFRDEARTAAKLDHEAIVTVYGSSTRRTPYWIEYKYLGGGSLRDRLNRGRLPWQEALRVFFILCSALDHAHRQNVIHRDIKPGNILFDENSRPYLTDFGISKDLDQTDHTQYGTQLGTPAYMSPEQTWGHPTTRATDVWSLGVVLFEMLTGRLPFPGPDAVLAHQIRHDPPLLLGQLASVPPGLEAVLLKALQKDPNQRHRGMAEFARAVQAVAPPVSSPTPTPTGEVWPPVPPRPPKWLVAALATVVTALLVVAGLLLNGSSGGGGGGGGGGPTVPVPDVRGLTVGEAKAKLADFTMGETKTVASGQAKGHVDHTIPPAGTRSKRKAAVALFVSDGVRPPIPIPEIGGGTVAEAKAKLARFTVTGTKPTDSSRPKDSVVGTQPAGGTLARPGSAVTLLVSRGPAPPPRLVPVPGVVGLSAESAHRKLAEKGFGSRDAWQYSSRSKGTVVGQSPKGGAAVRPHASVTLYVSKGSLPPPPPAPPQPVPPPGQTPPPVPP